MLDAGRRGAVLMMSPSSIENAAVNIALRIRREIRAGRLALVDFNIRCAVAGYLARGVDDVTVQNIEDLENLALRKFIEVCACT
jgi:ribosomal protein L32E